MIISKSFARPLAKSLARSFAGSEGTVWNGLMLRSSDTSSIYLGTRGAQPNCEYSLNGTKWLTMPTDSANAVSFKKIYIRGTNSGGFATGQYAYATFVMTGSPASASGSIMSLVDGVGESTTIPGSGWCFYKLFDSQDTLTSVPSLPATTLTPHCYASMFTSCHGLTTVPSDLLPATTLAEACYQSMFVSCGYLTNAPALPATTMVDSCYSNMFNGCSDLVTAPALPALTLAPDCYNSMFQSCTELTVAPELPALTLARSCYAHMFRSTAIVQAPHLKAPTLVDYCYFNMFIGCSSLNEMHCAATDITASFCTGSWLSGVSATGDFYGHSGTAWSEGESGIPANWTRHYSDALKLTFSLKSPGIRLKYGDNLEVSDNGTSWAAYTRDSVHTITDSKIVYFRGKSGATPVAGFNFGASENNSITSIEGDPMCLVDYDLAESIQPNWYHTNENTSAPLRPLVNSTSISHSNEDATFDASVSLATIVATVGGTEVDLPYTANAPYDIKVAITPEEGCQFVQWEDESTANPRTFHVTEDTIASGTCEYINVNCGQFYKYTETAYGQVYQTGLFEGAHVVDASGLVLSRTNVNCYRQIFKDNPHLTTPPTITNADGSHCFTDAFQGCTSLAGDNVRLNATHVGPYAYSGMFSGLGTASLKNVVLPALSLSDHCYYRMFAGCNDKVEFIEAFTGSPYGFNRYADGDQTRTEGGVAIPMKCWKEGVSGSILIYTDTLNISTTTSVWDYTDGVWTNMSHLSVNPWHITYAQWSGLDSTPDLPATTLAPYCYASMFEGCYALQESGTIAATTLATGCCDSMFRGCQDFELPVSIPATSLAPYCFHRMYQNTCLTDVQTLHSNEVYSYCFSRMYQGCKEIQSVPLDYLPAESLAEGCYEHMFADCPNLTVPPELPATDLAPACYRSMFDSCTSLTGIAALEASELKPYCYQNMYSGCTGISGVISTSISPADAILADYCYAGMFSGCTSITGVPEDFLPSETLAPHCYYSMFSGCTALFTVPDLPALTLTLGCYESMFSGCTSLTHCAQILNPTTYVTILASNCCKSMYQDCTSLGIADVPSGNAASHCFDSMFSGCTSVTNANFTTQQTGSSPFTLADYCYAHMFHGCSSLATYYDLKQTQLADHCYAYMYANTGNLSISITSRLPDGFVCAPYCCEGMFSGSLMTASTQGYVRKASALAEGCFASMYENCTHLAVGGFMADLDTTLAAAPRCCQAMYRNSNVRQMSSTTANVIINRITPLATSCFEEMFSGCTNLSNPSGWSVPAVLAPRCFSGMFAGCTSLTSFPIFTGVTTLASSCCSYMYSGCTGLSPNSNLFKFSNAALAEDCYSHMFQYCTALTSGPLLPSTTHVTGATGYYAYMFQGCTSLVNPPALPKTSTLAQCYKGMFKNCTALTKAPVLSASVSSTEAYAEMFYGCSALQYVKCNTATAPTEARFNNWLYGVNTKGVFVTTTTGWASGASGIPSTWTTRPGEYLTFSGGADFTSISLSHPAQTEISDDATTWSSWDGTAHAVVNNTVYVRGKSASGATADAKKVFGFSGSFTSVDGSVSSLVDYDNVLTATLPTNPFGYYGNAEGLFLNCSSLENASNLVLSTSSLVNNCFTKMFKGCSSLTVPPNLPSLTVPARCYINMFVGCSSLTTVPMLPSTYVSMYSYNSMFKDCTSLVTVPSDMLPSTYVAANGYDAMFSGCTSLESAPNLPATTTNSDCYSSMFYGCTNLKGTISIASRTNPSSFASNMFQNAGTAEGAGGTIKVGEYKENWVSYAKINTNHWNVGFISNVLRFKPVSGSTSVSLVHSNERNPDCEYSKDFGSTWSQFTTASVSFNDWIYIRGNNPEGFSSSFTSYSRLSFENPVNASGSIMSLIDQTGDTTTIPNSYCFYRLFKSTKVSTTPYFTATNTTDSCYAEMFYEDPSLDTIRALPALTVADNAYRAMFQNCVALYSAPSVLPATSVGYQGYRDMFRGCRFLQSAPGLHVTTLTGESACASMFQDCINMDLGGCATLQPTSLTPFCYSGMFSGCTSLQDSPALPATTLANYCYQGMFQNCTALSYLPTLSATNLAEHCYSMMFYKCTSISSAPALPATTLEKSCYRDMFFGCIGLTSSPALPATTLAQYCYAEMFSGCTALVTPPSLPAETLVTSCYSWMFQDCTKLTGPVLISATTAPASAYTSSMFANSGTSRTATPTDYNKIKVAANISAWNLANAGIDSTYWTVELQ